MHYCDCKGTTKLQLLQRVFLRMLTKKVNIWHISCKQQGKCLFLHRNYINMKISPMEDKKFNNRLEQVQWYEQQQGWGPLTDEDRQALDEAVRMVTNL